MILLGPLVASSLPALAQNVGPGPLTLQQVPSWKAGRLPFHSRLSEYEWQSVAVKNLIVEPLNLTTQGLYHYAYADPANGGVDCFGTVYLLSRNAVLNDVPRDAAESFSLEQLAFCKVSPTSISFTSLAKVPPPRAGRALILSFSVNAAFGYGTCASVFSLSSRPAPVVQS